MTLWLALLALGGSTPMDLVVGNVTCASCAVSIRSVLKRAHVRLVEQKLAMPYAWIRIQPEDQADLPGAVKTLEKIGYPTFVVVPDSLMPESSDFQQVVVGEDTLRVLPAQTWLALNEPSRNHKEGAP